jgi:uncharacterized protein YceK
MSNNEFVFCFIGEHGKERERNGDCGGCRCMLFIFIFVFVFMCGCCCVVSQSRSRSGGGKSKSKSPEMAADRLCLCRLGAVVDMPWLLLLLLPCLAPADQSCTLCLLACFSCLSVLSCCDPSVFSVFAIRFWLLLINDALFVTCAIYTCYAISIRSVFTALLTADGSRQRDSEIAPPEGLYLACDVRYRYRYRCSVHGGHENQHRCRHSRNRHWRPSFLGVRPCRAWHEVHVYYNGASAVWPPRYR